MKAAISVIISTIIFLFTSCNYQKSGQKYPEVIKININNNKRPLLDVTIEEIIQLETSEISLIGRIFDLKYFNNNYYIFDFNSSKALFAFDTKGKFLNRTVTGKGPGELVSPIAFTINKQDSVIIVHDQVLESNFIFDPMLNFIESEKLQDNFVLNLYHINSDTFLIYQNLPSSQINSGNKKYYNYSIITDKLSKKIPINILNNQNKTSLFLSNSVSITADALLFIVPYNYNIYQLSNNQPFERYKLDFGNYNFNPDELELLSSKELRDLAFQDKKVAGIESIFDCDDFMVIKPIYTRKSLNLFRSKESGKIYCLNDNFNKEIPDCRIWGSTVDGRFYAVVEPEDFSKYQQESGQHKELKISANDNPIIIRLKISEPGIFLQKPLPMEGKN